LLFPFYLLHRSPSNFSGFGLYSNEDNMDKQKLISLGITAAALIAAYKFAPNPMVRTAVLGVAGVVVIRNTPIVNQYVAV